MKPETPWQKGELVLFLNLQSAFFPLGELFFGNKFKG